MIDSDRIKEVIKWSGLNANAFAKKVGYDRGQVIYDIIKGKNKITGKISVNIVKSYPEINLNWILTGEGNMLKEQPDNAVANEQLGTYEPKNENDTVPRLEYEFIKKQLEEKDKQISKLLNLLSLTTSENEEDKKEEVA